jgi:hypothetical protein
MKSFQAFSKYRFFFLIAFFSHYLNYFVIIVWTCLNYIGHKNNPIVVNLLNINLKRFKNKIMFVSFLLWPCIAHPIYLLQKKKKKKNPTFLKEKILIPFIISGARPTSSLGPKRDQLVLATIGTRQWKLDQEWNCGDKVKSH